MLKPAWPSSLPYTDAHTLSQSYTGTYEHTHRHMYMQEATGATACLESKTENESVSANVL